MDEDRYEAVLRRVEDLESEVRIWRRAATGLTLAIIALATMGLAIPRGRIVEAQKFVLKDAEGRVRAELGPSDTEKQIALRFKDEIGSPRLTLGVEGESSLLVLSDKSGRPRIGMVTLAEGVPGLTFYDTTGRARAEVGLAREGEASVTLLDARGGPVWKSP
ncbi:MAG TPA: hypothetical protein VGT02_19750 [Methylomirabilota bacterium]|jgi:hypothetical protein|nr:hypothetical protein [Methylomirabilota bacterium]